MDDNPPTFIETTTSSHDTAPGAIATRDCTSWRRIACAIACASTRHCAAHSLGAAQIGGDDPGGAGGGDSVRPGGGLSRVFPQTSQT